MGLFDQVLGAISNPQQQASVDQLGSILGAVQQLSAGQGVDANAMQGVVSNVGGFVRTALQEKRAAEGNAGVEALVNQFAGTGANPVAMQLLFPPQKQQQIAETVAQRTGLDPSLVRSLLPAVVPIVLKLLQTGAPTPGAAATAGAAPTNSVLNTFLDTDGDGDVDMADTLSMAGKFLQNR
jgi:hypothetical protein